MTHADTPRRGTDEPDDEPPQRVFVYGSLMAGERNHHVMGPATFVREATTRDCFALHDLGPFPGMVARAAQGDNTPSSAVHGEVYEVDAVTLAHLDAFEGHPHPYRRTLIELDGGEQAWAYVFDADLARHAPIVASGDWRARARR